MKNAFIIAAAAVILAAPARGQRIGNIPHINPPLSFAEDTVTVNPIGNGGAALLAESLLGEDSGIEISNVNLVTDANGISAGFFSNGTPTIGFEEGIILSSGDVEDVLGPNESDGTSVQLNTPGDADLDAIVSGSTFDATVLEFDFVPQGNKVVFEYVFTSEEYNEYVFSEFNDVFAFFVNGVNYALLPDGVTEVSINTINNGFNSDGNNAQNPEFFVDNDLSDIDPEDAINIEPDGLTVVLTLEAPVVPNQTNTMKLAIADRGDRILDSWVFIKGESFKTLFPLNLGKFDGLENNECEDVYAYPGETLTYAVCFDNLDNDVAINNVTITDILPGEVAFVSASDGGQYDEQQHTVTWTIPSVPADAEVDCVLVEVLVDETLAPGSAILNGAQISFFDPGTDEDVLSTRTKKTLVAPYYKVDWPGANSYFEAVLNYGGTEYVFPGYCADLEELIQLNAWFAPILYSSLNKDGSVNQDGGTANLGAPVDNPQNLDKVNYILNQFQSGAYIGIDLDNDGLPDADAGWPEAQAAVWKLLYLGIRDVVPAGGWNSGFIVWDDAVANWIFQDAQAFGHGFAPPETGHVLLVVKVCDEQTTSILVPYALCGELDEAGFLQ